MSWSRGWVEAGKWQRPFRMLLALALVAITGADAGQNGFRAREHTRPPPAFLSLPAGERAAFTDLGIQVEVGRPARELLTEHRRLAAALDRLPQGRPGRVEAFILAVALDSDPVFGREAREAGRVLARRYGAAARTLVLAGSDGSRPSDLPFGNPGAIATALAGIAERMDPDEDILVLFTTSHGSPTGLFYHDGDQGYGEVSPRRLAAVLDELGIKRRLIVINACYSGIFIRPLASEQSIVVTAASTDRSSFGCFAENDWTFFGDAFVNRALRKPQPLDGAFFEARNQVALWETQASLLPSRPQVSIGAAAASWLGPLEAALPADAGTPVGRPTDIAALIAAKREAEGSR